MKRWDKDPLTTEDKQIANKDMRNVEIDRRN